MIIINPVSGGGGTIKNLRYSILHSVIMFNFHQTLSQLVSFKVQPESKKGGKDRESIQ